MVTLADPKALKVQKAIFAVSRTCSLLALEDELYAERWLAEDIVNYRAAAISALYFPGLIHDQAHKSILQIDNGIIGAEKINQINKYGARYIDPDEDVLDGYDSGDLNWIPRSISTKTGVKYLRDWQALYSYNGEPYRSLNRTLMNLPGGIPMHLLWRLGFIKLPRPITNRLELSLVIGYLRYEVRNPNWDVILHARNDHIKTALGHLSDHVRIDLNHRKWSCIQYLAMYLHDYPDRHTGNVVGLVDRSIVWHREFADRHTQQEIQKFDGVNAAIPPIELPKIPGITFLTNVSAICQEGARMHHCISSYSRQAVEGRCYLFHIEKDGEEASVMVTYNGEVSQSYGPMDCQNKASIWGARILRSWGKSLNNSQPANIRHPLLEEVPF